MPFNALVAATRHLQPDDLHRWVRDELVVPSLIDDDLIFADADCARVRLICTLHYDLEVTADALPVILSLLDQLHRSRASLRALSAAVSAQDSTVRASIMALLQNGSR